MDPLLTKDEMDQIDREARERILMAESKQGERFVVDKEDWKDEPRKPTPGRIVWYQTDGRNGLDYILPAIVTVTAETHPGSYPDGKENSLKVPSDPMAVHLTVFTPGGFGSTYVVDGEEHDYEQETMPNLGRPDAFLPGSGTYVEHDVPFDGSTMPPDAPMTADGKHRRRSWRWPERS